MFFKSILCFSSSLCFIFKILTPIRYPTYLDNLNCFNFLGAVNGSPRSNVLVLLRTCFTMYFSKLFSSSLLTISNFFSKSCSPINAFFTKRVSSCVEPFLTEFLCYHAVLLSFRSINFGFFQLWFY